MGEKGIDNFEYVEANQCFVGEHTTQFGLNYNMDQMKDMVRDADPGTVKKVAQGWAALGKDLVGSGGIKETFDAAVEHVLAHWEGKSADLFRERARIVGQKITDSAKYAHYASQSLEGAAETLAKIKPIVLAMEKPSKLSSVGDFIGDLGDRDASGADSALKGGANSSEALAKHEGSLSAGREAQLKMAEQMEILGAAYNRRAMEMGSWKRTGGVEDGENYPGDPGGIPPAAVVVPTGNVRGPQGATGGSARGGQVGTINPSKPVAPPSGITGGAHKPAAPQPQVSTAIDGVTGGRTGAPTVGGPSTANGGPAGGGVVGGSTGGVVPGAVVGAGGGRAGVGGMAGRGATGAGAGGMVGRGAAGAGAGGMVGRGAAGAGAAGGATKGGAARAGGVVGGTPRAGAGAAGGRGTAGGTGLHRSRGAAGGAGAVRKGGMVGAPGARTGRPQDEERREGERPDYLVEDEETWTPQTNAAPRVIE
ncbi:hypothetical protein AB0L74_09995 [Streptomyces sp. NPDC052020]|uniref:hypothetical protein n=1 Tax=Streptomyces sp. NPDC052020 TaxID=3155677 RepID=UPI00342D9D3E